jgi:hypothetical protein
MKRNQQRSKSEEATKVEAALNRARQRARELAAQTGTPLVIYSDGKIKKLRVRPKPTKRRAA